MRQGGTIRRLNTLQTPHVCIPLKNRLADLFLNWQQRLSWPLTVLLEKFNDNIIHSTLLVFTIHLRLLLEQCATELSSFLVLYNPQRVATYQTLE